MEMEKTPVKTIEKIVPFGTGTAKLTIFEENAKKAIERGWESLYYAENSVEFASLETENELFCLVTNGLVSIVGVDTQEKYTNAHPDDIEKLLDRELVNGHLSETNYVIEDNNWFAVILYEQSEPGSSDWYGKDDVLFEDLPTTLDELEKAMLECATLLLE